MEAAGLASRILYQSDCFIVVNKLPGESVEGVRPAARPGVRRAARPEAGLVDLPRLLAGATGPSHAPMAVHRLDVPVSGCVLFARTQKALAAGAELFREGRVEKRYWALVEMPAGPAMLDSLQRRLKAGPEIVHWISFDAQRNKSAAHDREAPGRKKAILRCRIMGSGERYLFLEIELLTGRHHQIRAQLAALGLHIKGDLKYGARRSEKTGGICLHARSLSLVVPGGECIRAAAPVPMPSRLWLAFEATLGAALGVALGHGLGAG